MIDRRQFMLAGASAAVVGGSLLLEGCGKTSMIRMIGEDSSNLKAIASVVGEFEQTAHIRTEVELLDFETAAKQAAIDFARKAGRYDIICQYNFQLSPYVRNKYVIDVAALKKAAPEVDFGFEQDLLPNVWRELGYYAAPPFKDFSKAMPIAYPFAANTMVLVYNKRVLADPTIAAALNRMAGRPFTVPATWQELAQAALEITRVAPSYKGIALQGAANGWLYYEWVNLLFGLGGRVMDKPWGWASDLSTPLQLSSPQVDEAVRLYLSMKPANAGDFLAVDAVVQRDLMMEGKTAFAIMWTDYIPDLVAKNGNEFGFAPVPGKSSMIAGGSFFVSQQSGHAAEAAAFISFLMQPATQKKLALAGLFPPTRTAMNDPEVLSKPYMAAVKASLERGVYMNEAGPDSELISQKITEELQRAWKGEIAAEDVGRNASAAIMTGRSALAAR